MTEQPPPEDAEPRSLPQGLGPVGEPNDLTPPDWKRTAMIVWGVIGFLFFGGLAVMALTWRSAALPSLPEAPSFSFEMPDLGVRLDRPAEASVPVEVVEKEVGRPPEGMELSRRGSAESESGIDKPDGEALPEPDAPLGVLIGGTYGDAER